MEIGLLQSSASAFAPSDAAIAQGTLLAVEHVNAQGGVLGEKIDVSLHWERNQRIPAGRFLRKRNTNTHLFGASSSSLRKRNLSLLEDAGILLWYPTQFEGYEASTNIVYTGASATHHVIPLTEYLMARGHATYALVGSDYVFPRDINRTARRVIEAAGGTVVYEGYLPLNSGASRVKELVERIPNAADVVLPSLVGDDYFDFLRLRGAGMLRRAVMASVIEAEATLDLAPELFAGTVVAMPYFDTVETSASTAFKKLFVRRFGNKARPTFVHAAAFSQILLFAQAAEKVRSFDTQAILGSLHEVRPITPLDDFRIDADTHYSHLKPRVGVADQKGRFQLVSEAAHTVAPDPYLLSYA